MKRIRKIIVVCICILCSAYFVFSADAKSSSAGTGTTPIDPYVIAEVDYYIQGSTIERILAKRIGIEEGREFPTREALDAYIAEKEQLLENERVLESSKIEAVPIEVRDGVTYVRFDVFTKDTWNLIALPYPKYDSNEGLLLSLRMRHYNFLGTMETLAFNIDYEYDENGETSIGADTSFTFPFHAVNTDWRWGLALEGTYNTSDNIFRFSEDTDVAMDFHFLIPWTLSIYQRYNLNEEDDGPDPDGYYLTNGVSIAASVPMGFDLFWLGPLTYSPSASLGVNYNFKDGFSISEGRRGPTLSLNMSLSAGKVNWKGNFRDGSEFSISNSNTYNFYSAAEGADYPWDHSVSGEYSGFVAASPFGFSTRLRGMWEYGDDSGGDEGGPVRGILDKRMKGDLAFYLNSDVAVKTWIWFLSRWFEMHTSVFFDMGVIRTYQGDFQEPFYGGGIEAVVFPKFARSLFMRASLGFDLEAMLTDMKPFDPAPRDGEQRYELSIGLGYHY